MENHHTDYDVVIIGSGVTGLGAAIYCGRFGLKTAVIGEKSGGTIILTDDVSNYPGFKKIGGMELADKLREHAEDYQIDFFEKKVDNIKRCEEGCFMVYSKEEEYHTKTIIYATGTEWKKLHVPREKELTGNGVHYCALCDGPLYKDVKVGIIGGSDSAAKEALLMADYASHVYVFVRGEKLRAEPINNKRVEELKKITVINNVSITEFIGDKKLEKIKLSRPINGKDTMALEGVFINVGHKPLTELAKKIGIKINDKKEIIIDRMSQTNIKGFYAAGDVVDTKFKQAITGVAEGVAAAYTAYHYINKNEFICLHEEKK